MSRKKTHKKQCIIHMTGQDILQLLVNSLRQWGNCNMAHIAQNQVPLCENEPQVLWFSIMLLQTVHVKSKYNHL